MSDVKTLVSRIDVAFSAVQDRLTADQQRELQGHVERQKSVARYEPGQAQVVEVARPRLQALADRAAGRAAVTPSVSASRRKVTFEFHSTKALVILCFSATPDRTLQNVVVKYDLSVVPVLRKFDSHAEFTTPIDAFDGDAPARWVDDRIVGFVDLYIQIHGREFYDQAEYVENPVANVRLPKFAAGATLDHDGVSDFFVDEGNRAEFQRRKGLATA